MIIKKGSTPTIVFLLVSTEDAVTGVENAQNLNVTISKNGGAFAAATNAVAQIGGGWYKVVLSAAETGADGPIIVRASADGTYEWRDIHQVYTPATPPVSLKQDEFDRIADHVIRRDFAQASQSTFGDPKQFRSLLGAVAKAVNRVELDGRTLKIYEADDQTMLGSQTVAVNNNPPAITELDTD
jgi:hypothetical protein